MANRQFRSQFLHSFDGMPVRLQAKITFGATGAPTLSTTTKGIASVSRTSAGLFVITLQDSYNALLGLSVAQITGSSAAAAPICTVVSEAVASSPAIITLQYRAINNSTATDPANGEIALVSILLSNSSV